MFQTLFFTCSFLQLWLKGFTSKECWESKKVGKQSLEIGCINLFFKHTVNSNFTVVGIYGQNHMAKYCPKCWHALVCITHSVLFSSHDCDSKCKNQNLLILKDVKAQMQPQSCAIWHRQSIWICFQVWAPSIGQESLPKDTVWLHFCKLP